MGEKTSVCCLALYPKMGTIQNSPWIGSNIAMSIFQMGGFLKWRVSPTISMGFPTKNDQFGV